MRLTLLGTGTPSPSLKRASSGYLIEVGGDTIVMDHGAGSHHRLLESGRKATDVTHVFFSHLHSDHCLDYPRLVLQRWDIGADRIPDLKVYGPPPLQRMTDLLFSRDGAFAADINARIEHPGSIDMLVARGGTPPRKWPVPQVTELKAKDLVEGGKWRVTVANASHMQPQLTCFGYRLDSAEGSLCYSGDSGGVCRDIIELARGTVESGIAFLTGEPGTLIRVQEREAGFFCDVEELLARFVPQDSADRLKHLLFLLGPGTEQIPFSDRKLLLGQWQRVMLFDLEGQSRGDWTLSVVG